MEVSVARQPIFTARKKIFGYGLIFRPDLEKAFTENRDERVKGMIVWAMGQIGNQDTGQRLKAYSTNHSGSVLEELKLAIQSIKDKNGK